LVAYFKKKYCAILDAIFHYHIEKGNENVVNQLLNNNDMVRVQGKDVQVLL
jgi:hypothetical protein